MRSTLLLLATDPDILIDVASAARDAGYLVAPGRHHESGIDALTRVTTKVALVHIGHEAADSMTFSGLAEHLGTEVYLFMKRDSAADERARAATVGARSPFPILLYEGDAAALIRAVDQRRQALAQPAE